MKYIYQMIFIGLVVTLIYWLFKGLTRMSDWGRRE